MTAPSTPTFELQPPRRPGPDDLDATVEDEGAPIAPIKGMLYASQVNQALKLIEAAWRMLPVCSIEIHFASGAPFIFKLQAARGDATPGMFTVMDNGNGDTTITWPAGAFPVAASSPTADMCEDGAWLAPTAIAGTFAGLPGVRVKTRSSAGALTNAAVKVHIH